VEECETRFCLEANANSQSQLADEDFACCSARHNQNRKYGNTKKINMNWK